MCAPDGGVIDDLIVYRTGPEMFLVVPNASNAATVAAALAERASGFEASVDDASDRTALIAVQGPRALDILAPLVDAPIGELRSYAGTEARVAGAPAWVARTGYTGEDGFELFLANDAAVPVWRALLDAAPPDELQPIGLGARDTLRLEAGMPLYGNELDLDTYPEEARLGRVVKLDKPGGFVGREALAEAHERGPRKLLVGLVLQEAGIARHGYPVLDPASTPDAQGERIGSVTSGTHSPSLGSAIAMAYVPPAFASAGTMVRVGVRTSVPAAEVVELPFHRRTPIPAHR
jgi:aminomethyltransferase